MATMTEEERRAFDLYAAAALQGLLANPVVVAAINESSPARAQAKLRGAAITYAMEMMSMRASALRQLATTTKRPDVTAKSKHRARAPRKQA